MDPILVDSAAGGAAAAAAAGAGKGGKKPARAAAAAAGSVVVTLESEWIVEHARQVSRMLPGGGGALSWGAGAGAGAGCVCVSRQSLVPCPIYPPAYLSFIGAMPRVTPSTTPAN